MSSIDLYYFEEELSYLREKAQEFAKVHPEVASALGINNGSIEDPQIARLIESICLLNAGVQQRLDDNYSDFTESVLNVTYPDFLRPIPSYSVLGVTVDPKEKTKGFIPQGTLFELKNANSSKEADLVHGNSHCYFKTVADLTVYPLLLKQVHTYVAPFDDINNITNVIAKNLIELEFSTTDDKVTCLDLGLDALDIALRSDSNASFKLYDELCHNLVDIYLEINGHNYRLGEEALSNKIFDLTNPLLPYSTNSYQGLNLLNEFLMFRDVFNQVHLDLSTVKDLLFVSKFKIKFFLKDMRVELFRSLQVDNFILFYVPVINLYEAYAEPITIDGLKDKYPLIFTEGNRQLSLYQVLSVTDMYDATAVVIPELYHETFAGIQSSKRWSVTLREANEQGTSLAGNASHDGSALGTILTGELTLIDLKHESVMQGNHSVLVKALVTDGNLPTKINYTTASLAAMSTITMPGKLRLLRRPSMQFRNTIDKVSNWEVVAHMSFNYQVILGQEDATLQLKRILKLYNAKASRKNLQLIEAIKSIEHQQVVEPIRINGKCCYVNGLKITLVLSSEENNDGIYVFSQFLDRYFASFVSYNSFIQLDVMLEGSDEVYKSFPRRLGCKQVI